LGKIDLKAKNPFGKDLDMGNLKTYWGLGLFAGAIVILGGMVVFAKAQAKAATKGIDGLHEKLRGR